MHCVVGFCSQYSQYTSICFYTWSAHGDDVLVWTMAGLHTRLGHIYTFMQALRETYWWIKSFLWQAAFRRTFLQLVCRQECLFSQWCLQCFHWSVGGTLVYIQCAHRGTHSAPAILHSGALQAQIIKSECPPSIAWPAMTSYAPLWGSLFFGGVLLQYRDKKWTEGFINFPSLWSHDMQFIKSKRKISVQRFVFLPGNTRKHSRTVEGAPW